MTLRSTSPKSSGSLRRSLSDGAGFVTLWSWIGARVVLGAISGGVDRLAAGVLSATVGSEPIDPRALDWSLRSVVDGGVR